MKLPFRKRPKTKMYEFPDQSVINIDEILEAADKVFASGGMVHELAVMELRSAVTTFRVQQASWSKQMSEYLKIIRKKRIKEQVNGEI